MSMLFRVIILFLTSTLFLAVAESRSQICSNSCNEGLAVTSWNSEPPHSPLTQIIQQGTFTALLGIDGSKQPQDFGANANLGAALRLAWSAPLFPKHGVGYQIGSRVTFTGNAVQVIELLGESKDRFQNFTTVGLFQASRSWRQPWRRIRLSIAGGIRSVQSRAIANEV